MELKKSKEANLEKKTLSFRLMGLVMVCAVVGMAFEHTEYEAIDEAPIIQEESDIISCFFDPPLVEPVEEETPPPPPIQIEEPVIVPDEIEVEDLDLSIIEIIQEEAPIDPSPMSPEPEIIYNNVDIEPTFPGGYAAMNQWIVDNISYPELASEMGEQGKVYVGFVVNKKGNIEKVSIRKGISDALDAEAKRVVKKMPKWVPGEKNGKPVSSNFTLPIHFKIG